MSVTMVEKARPGRDDPARALKRAAAHAVANGATEAWADDGQRRSSTTSGAARAGREAASAAAAQSATIVALPAIGDNGARPVAPSSSAAADRGALSESADARFFAARARGQAAFAGALWVAMAAAVVTHASGVVMSAAPAASAAVSVGVGVGLYAVSSVIVALVLDHAMERRVAMINQIARLGCERLKVDDVSSIRDAVRDVLGEWMHINFFARRFVDWSFYLAIGFALQGAITLGALAYVAASWPAPSIDWIALMSAGAALTLIHVVVHVARLRAQTSRLGATESDPTEVLAERMVALLVEVKALRKPLLSR